MRTSPGAPATQRVDGVEVTDLPVRREHAPADLLGVVVSALGIVIVLVLGVYAHGTTIGVTEDVQAVTKFLNSLFSIAVSVIGGLVSVVLPAGVLVRLMWRRRIRRSAEAVAALALGTITTQLLVWLLDRHPGQLWESLSVTAKDATVAAMAPFAAGLAAMLILAGPRSADTWVRWCWNLLWISLGIEVVTGSLTLPGALVSLWLGTLIGWALRYALGSRPDRAYGEDLLGAIRQTGLKPARVVRVLGASDLARLDRPGTSGGPAPASSADAGNATSDSGLATEAGAAGADAAVPSASGGTATASTAANGRQITLGTAGSSDAARTIAAVSDPGTLAVAAHSEARVYAVFAADGERRDVVMFDADRRVVGLIERGWQALRLRGLADRAVVSLHQAAEHAALVTMLARQAGVRVPQLAGIGEGSGSIAVAQEHVAGARRLRDLDPGEIDDALLAAIWRQVLRAQDAALSHGSISADVVLLTDSEPDGEPAVWLIGWDSGGVAAQDLALRIDRAQTLAMIALAVGAPRAVASAAAALGTDELAQVAPVLQAVTLPRETRADAKEKRQVMADLRAELVALIPAVDDAQPIQLQRFSWRTVLTATVLVAAAWVLLATMNFDEIVHAITSANPWWIGATFLIGLLPYLASTMELIAFCPTKLPFWRTTWVQLAGSIVALVAPAAIGPTAINLTYLRRRKVSTPLAVATIALSQVLLFVTTVVMLVVIALTTGEFSALTALPTTAVLVVVALVAVVGSALAIPQVRTWVWAKVGPMLQQVWPRLVWVLGQPRRLAIGLIGTSIHSIGYVLAFWAATKAFGITGVPFTTVAIIYLLGNTAGSALPTPGGAGTVELALTGGLVSAGVAQAVAASAAVLFRAMTFWLMAPIGWVALRYVRKTGDV